MNPRFLFGPVNSRRLGRSLGVDLLPFKTCSLDCNRLAGKLAARKHISKTDAVKLALENELRRLDEAQPLRERLRPLHERVLARPPTGQRSGKAFHDDFSGGTECSSTPRRSSRS